MQGAGVWFGEMPVRPRGMAPGRHGLGSSRSQCARDSPARVCNPASHLSSGVPAASLWQGQGRACPDFPSALRGVPYPALPRGHSLPGLRPPPCGLSACPFWSSQTEQSGGHTPAQRVGPRPPQRRQRGGGGAVQLGGPDQPRVLHP